MTRNFSQMSSTLHHLKQLALLNFYSNFHCRLCFLFISCSEIFVFFFSLYLDSNFIFISFSLLFYFSRRSRWKDEEQRWIEHDDASRTTKDRASTNSVCDKLILPHAILSAEIKEPRKETLPNKESSRRIQDGAKRSDMWQRRSGRVARWNRNEDKRLKEEKAKESPREQERWQRTD